MTMASTTVMTTTASGAWRMLSPALRRLITRPTLPFRRPVLIAVHKSFRLGTTRIQKRVARCSTSVRRTVVATPSCAPWVLFSTSAISYVTGGRTSTVTRHPTITISTVTSTSRVPRGVLTAVRDMCPRLPDQRQGLLLALPRRHTPALLLVLPHVQLQVLPQDLILALLPVLLQDHTLALPPPRHQDRILALPPVRHQDRILALPPVRPQDRILALLPDLLQALLQVLPQRHILVRLPGLHHVLHQLQLPDQVQHQIMEGQRRLNPNLRQTTIRMTTISHPLEAMEEEAEGREPTWRNPATGTPCTSTTSLSRKIRAVLVKANSRVLKESTRRRSERILGRTEHHQFTFEKCGCLLEGLESQLARRTVSST
ncbi:hypothetical protein HPB51_018760 [Rhipicephalus microplus]|uniref:Uncharacterized protein n=1 Tax=Rhipicephalus microplus TaxID=6941 RepID=A0A9J6DIM2_RHIMP|nr:hypothetical protein HPB51_018760 [Rhipicephalus microplus]